MYKKTSTNSNFVSTICRRHWNASSYCQRNCQSQQQVDTYY